MRAVLTLDDQDSGVGLTLFLEDGFQKDSQAHQAANALVKHLESLSAIQSTGEVAWVEGEDAQWIKDPVIAAPEAVETRQTSLASIVTDNAADLQR